MKVIFHIDLNAFFVSAELLRHPEYKGKPVVVGHDAPRSVCATASYEARQYGIHSAMPIMQAKKLCRHLIIVRPDFEYYRSLSQKFFNIVKRYSPYVEKASIDECYVDMSNYIEERQIQPYVIADEIQKSVFSEIGISCSIGISPNKFLSKMASDLKKPMGITIITKNNIKDVLWPMPVDDMHGIGKKTAPKLKEAGILTIGDIANGNNYQTLKTILGSSALIYYNRANGRDMRDVDYQPYDPKSVGNSHTFERDIVGEELLSQEFKKLAHSVSKRAKARNLISKNISITLRDNTFHTIQRSMIMNNYTDQEEILYAYALMLLRESYNNEPIRLIGLTMNKVMPRNQVYIQTTIFDKHVQDPNNEIEKIVDEHKDVLKHASDLLKNKDQVKS
ncbi:MAG: DNA polymerase IV [Erysipelotrichaceae bacterium]|nr:DNA polymerase IV [Erysipelotrichaceae bacterium]